MRALLAAAALVLTLVGGGHHAHRFSVVRTLHLPAGRTHASFPFRVRAKFAHSARLVVTRGAIVQVRARSANGYEQLEVWTRPWQPWRRGGWPDGCRHRARRDLCVQQFERCPVFSSWRVAVRKTSTAPAFVRVRFVFGR